jgi:hypothetical protein
MGYQAPSNLRQPSACEEQPAVFCFEREVRPVFWSLVALRVYMVALIVLVIYRFSEYARL